MFAASSPRIGRLQIFLVPVDYKILILGLVDYKILFLGLVDCKILFLEDWSIIKY